MSGIRDGAALMRGSWELVRGDRALLWFPVAASFCLLVTAGFWLFEGAWVASLHGPWFLFVPVVVLGIYSLTFVGIFFNVALAGAADAALAGREATFREGLSVAWSRLGSIAGWATYSVVVQLALSFVESIKGFRWVGKAAEVAWSFATFFVIPLIALEGLGAGDARQRSFRLAKENWRTETGGLATLREAMFVPCLLFAGAFELLKSGQVPSRAGQAFLGLVLVVGVVVGVVATVVRQVLAVSLYRTSAA